MSDTVQLNVKIPEETHRKLKMAAVEKRSTIAKLTSEALAEYLEQLEDAELGPRAQAAYEEWKRDPSTARPWEEFEAELRADGLIDD